MSRVRVPPVRLIKPQQRSRRTGVRQKDGKKKPRIVANIRGFFVKVLSCMVLRAGGDWGASSDCGSRCRYAYGSLSNSAAPSGARGKFLPKNPFYLGVKSSAYSCRRKLSLQNWQIVVIGFVDAKRFLDAVKRGGILLVIVDCKNKR